MFFFMRPFRGAVSFRYKTLRSTMATEVARKAAEAAAARQAAVEDALEDVADAFALTDVALPEGRSNLGGHQAEPVLRKGH